MAYDTSKPWSYGIPNGTYRGRATTASCFEKDGRLILDVNFAVVNPQTGDTYKNDRGYDFEAKKRHWLTTAEGAFNEVTIRSIRDWAKGWNPQTFDDFYWFQSPDANGVPFGNLAAIGEVELVFKTNGHNGGQDLYVNDPNRVQQERKAFVPDGAETDRAKISAKWGSKARALFAATPKVVGAAPAAPVAASAPVAAQSAPVRPAPAPVAAPARPAEGRERWSAFPMTADGAFSYYCSRLPVPYESAKHDGRWFEIYDANSGGKDPDQMTPQDAERLFAAVDAAM